MASAASEAENFVFAPISLALSVSLLRSIPVAPETAATFDMAASKSEPTLTASPPAAATAVPTPARAVTAISAECFAAEPILLKALDAAPAAALPCWLTLLVSFLRSFSAPALSILVSIVILPSANNPTCLSQASSAHNGST